MASGLTSTSILPSGLIAAAALTFMPISVSQTAAPIHLIPMPREFRSAPAQSLANGLQIDCAAPCDPEDASAVQDFKASLEAKGVALNPVSAVNILIVRFGPAISKGIYRDSLPGGSAAATGPIDMPEAMKPEGYSIIPDGKGLAITAATASGIFYALQTVKQLVEVTPAGGAVLHTAFIRDWPAMKYRGLQDDLSRGPVTTLEFEKIMIRTLAAYKINLYSPYFEHTAAYASDPLPAPPGGTITAADAAALVAYAKPYHVLIVPEQEAFGHLHHNLTWEQYQPLAETPHGEVLAPGQPGSLALSTRMLTELAAQYPGPLLHIGADETVDLGLGQTKADVDARGLAPVYLDYLQSIVSALEPLHRRLLFWGDIAQDAPLDVLKGLPDKFKQSTIAIAWVYSPESKGYEKFLKPFITSGFETWVAPSVNNFRKVYPNNNYALANIQGLARDGQRLGSTGLLNTIWNDDGEGLFNQDWYGVLFGAAAAWQPGESSILQFQDSYAQVFHNDGTGKLNQAQKELMAAHSVLRDQAKVGDAGNSIFWLDPFSKDGQKISGQIRPYTHDLRLHAEAALTLIAQAKAAAGLRPPPASPSASGTFYDAARYGAASSYLAEPDAIDAMELGARRMDLIGMNFQLANEIAQGYQRAYAAQATTDKKQRAAVTRELSDINGINGRIEDIRDAYSLLRDMYEAAWLASNRPYALRPVLEHYDYTVGVWLAKSDRLRSALRQWNDSHTLPPASEVDFLFQPRSRRTDPPTSTANDSPRSPKRLMSSRTPAIGIDFGTTNSSVAILTGGKVELVEFTSLHGPTPSYRSVLYLEQLKRAGRTELKSFTGPQAIEQYLHAETPGRLIQSLKSYLPSRSLTGTEVFGRRYKLEDLIARILTDLRLRAEQQTGRPIRHATVGRPVRFVAAETAEDDAFAASRLEAAFLHAGFETVTFEYEPVAAAYAYESTLHRDELILIGDFGGGTSDFSLLHVGPEVRARGSAATDLLGNAGLGLAGDAFDARIVRKLVSPALGSNSFERTFSHAPDRPAPIIPAVPAWIYANLERWHYLSFLKTRNVTEILKSARARAEEPEKVAALITLIEEDLGYQLHQAVQRLKVELSTSEAAEFRFHDGSMNIAAPVTRAEFEAWIADDLAAIEMTVDGLLQETGVAPDQVGRVFLTGGTSFVPSVRRIFDTRFRRDRVRTGNEFTSVAQGLALSAARKGA